MSIHIIYMYTQIACRGHNACKLPVVLCYILIEQLVLFVQTTAIYRIEYVGILGVPGLYTINVHEYLCMFNSACMCRMEPLHWR